MHTILAHLTHEELPAVWRVGFQTQEFLLLLGVGLMVLIVWHLIHKKNQG